MLLSLLLGLGSSFCWGTADFFGGLQSRRLPALAVVFWSQLIGGAALGLLLLLLGGAPTGASILWGLVGGLSGCIALIVFYHGLSIGMMSIISPIASCGAMVPIVVAFAYGEVPSLVTTAGIGIALVGIVLVSLQPQTSDGFQQPLSFTGKHLALALGAALGFGLFFVFVDLGSEGEDLAPLWVIAAARLSSLIAMSVVFLVTRQRVPWPARGQFGQISSIGLLDTTANVLFGFASLQGNLAVAAVLSSLYPVTTILLSYRFLDERLTKFQLSGVVLVLVGIVTLTLGAYS